mgnify:CR=1 FL=1
MNSSRVGGKAGAGVDGEAVPGSGAGVKLLEPTAYGDLDDDVRWRSEFLYSRAATIYGGTAEVQRNIIARRLLDLGEEQ